MRLARFAVHHPVTTCMALAGLLVLGVISIPRVPLAWLPEVDFPGMWIQVPYPNSNPEQVERMIARPIEEALATLKGIKSIRSYSEADQAGVELSFDWEQDVDLMRLEVSEALDRARSALPPDVQDIFIFKFSTSDIPVIWGRISAPGKDLSRSYELLETKVINRLDRVPGVGKVELDGVSPREARIYLALDRIREHSVDVRQLMQRLREVQVTTSIGTVTQDGLRFSVRTLNDVDTVGALEHVPVGANGLRLGDVARIYYGPPLEAYGRHLDLEDSVAIAVYKESTANTVDVVRAATHVIEDEIAKDPELAGIKLFVFDDQAKEIVNGLSGLAKAGITGALLATVILFLFLRRVSATAIVCCAIPTSIIVTFTAFYMLDKSLNILTMMGLMLGVGMLVDNSIVVLESIYRKRQQGLEPMEASIVGTSEVSMAVISSTLTSIIVFLPLIVGKKVAITVWLSEVGITISITLLASLAISLTIIPLFASRFLTGTPAREGRVITWLKDWHGRLIGWTLRRWLLAFVAITLVFVAGIFPLMSKKVDTNAFSGGKNTALQIHFELSDHFYKSEAEKVVDQAEAWLDPRREELEIDTIYSFYMENRAETRLHLTRDLGEEEMKALRKRLREELPVQPGVRIRMEGDEDDGGIVRFRLSFFGDSSPVLRRFAERAAKILEGVEGIEDIQAEDPEGREEVHVSVNRDKARRNGLSPFQVSQVFGFALGGVRLKRLVTSDREVEVLAGLEFEDRETLDDLKRLVVANGVALGDIADFRVVRQPTTISRENRTAVASVWASYEGESFSEAREEIKPLIDALQLPPGYSWSWGSRTQRRDEEGKQMGINFLLALVLIYIVMASLFESLSHPFAIVLCIPLALVGVSWLLFLTGTRLNIMGQIGLLVLLGIVVNNGIVLIDRIRFLRDKGLERRDAILTAGRDRLRPILMTALTTILGLVPLALGRAAVGGGYYFPLARTVIGGLIAGTFLSLVALPYVYVAVDNFSLWAARVWHLSRPRSKVAPLPEA